MCGERHESPGNGYRFDDGALNRYPQFQSETLNTAYATMLVYNPGVKYSRL